jgi:N utilization substance protein B
MTTARPSREGRRATLTSPECLAAADEPAFNPAELHRGREAALQLLYQWEIGRVGEPGPDADALYWTAHPAPEPRQTFAAALARGTAARAQEIDPLIATHARNWRLSRMAVLDRLILRMAIYEFLCGRTPPPVVIDEAIELAKTFSGDQSAGFVNGVLDSVRRQIAEDRSVDGA